MNNVGEILENSPGGNIPAKMSDNGASLQKPEHAGLSLLVKYAIAAIVLIFTAVMILFNLNLFTEDKIPMAKQSLASSATADSPGKGIEAKNAIEMSLEKRAHDILDRILGPDRSIVTVNADLDMEVVKRIREAGNGSEGFQENVVTEYVQAPGEIRRLSVTVIINGSYRMDKEGRSVFVPIPESEIRNIENVLKQALGFDEMRDDSITVTSMPFAGDADSRNKWSARFKGENTLKYSVILSSSLLLIICMASLIVFTAKGRKRKVRATEQQVSDENIRKAIKTVSDSIPKPRAENATEMPAKKPNDQARLEGPFATLDRVDTQILTDYLKGEHPQTIAVVLAHLNSAKSAKIITGMPEKIQGEVVYRMACLGVIPKVVIDELDQVMKRDIEAMGAYDGSRLGGIESVAGIMNHLDLNTENIIFASLEDTDPLLADRIRQKMFVFEDIMNIDGRGIQTLLKEISNEDLIIALKTASDELKDKIFTNMSARASEMLREDIESLGPVRVTDVESSQQNIIRVARKLERLGRLVIAGKGREDILV